MWRIPNEEERETARRKLQAKNKKRQQWLDDFIKETNGQRENAGDGVGTIAEVAAGPGAAPSEVMSFPNASS